MADRTWNSVDSRLYEERWTQPAKLIAGVLLARCPNQYGIFDMPWWFLETVFAGIYDFEQIQAAAKEWEDAEFVKFYNDRKLVWIRKKWKREQKNPSDLNIKGALNFLKDYPKPLADDFCTLYEIDKPLISPLQGDDKGSVSVSVSDSVRNSNKKVKILDISLQQFPQGLVDVSRKYFPSMTDEELYPHIEALFRLSNIDGYDLDEIREVILWLTDDDSRDAEFWRGVTKSFVRFRQSKDGVKCHKYINLLSAYKRNNAIQTGDGEKTLKQLAQSGFLT